MGLLDEVSPQAGHFAQAIREFAALRTAFDHAQDATKHWRNLSDEHVRAIAPPVNLGK